MSFLFSDHGSRLLSEQCRDGAVGGFMVTRHYPYSETIYAVFNDGRIYMRVSSVPDPSFAASAGDWMRTVAVAPDAEWIGQYPSHVKDVAR